jgi:hypothetical protein
VKAPPKEKQETDADRVLLDLHRARQALGQDFTRDSPLAGFYLRRAKLHAVLEVGNALRGRDGSPADDDDADAA